jgi:spermidine/putrescine transport system permease protein
VKSSRALGAYCAALYSFLYLPLIVMTVFSFNNAHRNVVWHGFTLKWYATLVHDAELINAVATSLEIAAAAAALAAVLGLLAAYALVRHRPFRGREGYAALLDAPLMVPEVALGVALLSFLVRAGYELDFGALACAHALICLPYTIGALRARLKSTTGAHLEEAAMDLGASPWMAFRRVTLPLLMPALASGTLLAFTVSFEDFVTSFFLAGVGMVTLPIKVYSMMKFGVTPEINALSVVLLGATLILLGLNAALLAREKA